VSAPSAIGRFRVERRLGAGGFATVWLAHDPELDAPVAVKLLADNWSHNADVRRRFTDEARLLRRVDSDHLVRVYDVGELPDGRPYFVMTYADRGSLADRLAVRPPPWQPSDVVRIVEAIAAGLAVLHEHGVVHRDLKPRNVLLRSTREGPERVLLGDLGIAKDLEWASGVTMPVGSDGYMAPEQRGFSTSIGPASDVYALAMTAAQLFGLEPPWPASPLGAVLARATAPEPADRTPSATAFATELRGTLTAAPTWPPANAPVAPVAPPVAAPPVAPPAGPGAPPTGTGAPPTGPPTALIAHETSATQLDAAPNGALRPGAPPPGRRGPAVRWLVLGAGVVVIALVATLTWRYLTRDRVMTPSAGHVHVAVPHDWPQQDGAAFPGGTDTSAGARAASGGRTITVAYNGNAENPTDVLDLVAPSGCTRGDTRNTAVGSWTGVTVHYTGCPDGSAVDEVVLGGQGGRVPWTVWLEVRSRSGSPDLTDVLAGVDVTP
jgi:eukaryotic-like serine/threonine-protein kinase